MQPKTIINVYMFTRDLKVSLLNINPCLCLKPMICCGGEIKLFIVVMYLLVINAKFKSNTTYGL